MQIVQYLFIPLAMGYQTPALLAAPETGLLQTVLCNRARGLFAVSRFQKPTTKRHSYTLRFLHRFLQTPYDRRRSEFPTVKPSGFCTVNGLKRLLLLSVSVSA